MIDFIDRASSGKKIIKYENGTTETVTIENAEDATVEGTPINRENMMAIQGFIASDTTTNPDGSITKINSKNETLVIYPWELTDQIKQKIVFSGKHKITLIKTLNKDGSISEVLQ